MEQCPYCRTELPAGAVVCRGCGAERTYGKLGDGTHYGAGGIVMGTVFLLVIVTAVYWFAVTRLFPNVNDFIGYTALSVYFAIIGVIAWVASRIRSGWSRTSRQ